MMDPDLRAALESALGSAVRSARPVAGGDINDAWATALADGRRVFAKTRASAPDRLFACEADGLRWLAEARALRVPAVLAVGEGRPAFLALELLEPGPRREGFDEALGRGLADLHRACAPSFGFARDNFIGSLPQANAALPTWAAFYRERRLVPQLRRAGDAGLVDAGLARLFDRLFACLDDLVGPDEPPARLHGDLWGGNLHTGPAGEPCLIDPAVYGGHREVDLAMMRLFGGFSPRAFDAYAERHPLAPGAEDRVALYQVYPLLVHVNLFGGSYVGSVRRAVSRYA